MLLIAANSQREKTAWDKLEEVRRMRDLQRQAKAQTGAGGRVRDRVAQSLHISSARVAKYDSILNNLTPALMEEIKADRLPVSAAYELSRLPEEEQLAAYTGLHEDKPAKAQKPRRQTAQPEPDDVFQSNTQTSPAGSADHLVQTICRLCSSDHAVLQQLAELLRYEPEPARLRHQGTCCAALNPIHERLLVVMHRKRSVQLSFSHCTLCSSFIPVCDHAQSIL